MLIARASPSQSHVADPPRGNASISLLFVAMGVLLLSTVAVTYWIGQISNNRRHEAAHLTDTIYLLTNLLSHMKDAETGQRGYLVTGDKSYLEPYQAGKQALAENLEDLRWHSEAGDLPQSAAAEITRLTREKLSELALTIGMANNGHPDQAVEHLRTNRGKQLMDNLRVTVSAALGKLRQSRDYFASQEDTYQSLRTLAFAGTAAVNLAFLIWALRVTRREMNRREQIRSALARQEELVRVTLASIGDGVIVTDTAGTVTFLNHAAESLIGLSSDAVVGKPIETIFQIVDDTTKKPSDNPVHWVLGTGAAQVKSNHSLLMRQDASELPVDHSASPVRDVGGKIRGAVLTFRDFTDFKNSQRELRKAKEQAEAANLSKDNFLASLSHELRTPLTPVLMSLTAWEQRRDLPADLTQEMTTIRRCVELEARLIDDLLDVTRIAVGKLSLQIEDTDVHVLLTSIIELYRSEIIGKNLRLSESFEATTHCIGADPSRLQQVFLNLLKNAVKFTPRGGWIRITTSNDARGQLVVQFHDSGIGMSDEVVHRIFQPFEQGPADLSRRMGGLGLGLSISRTLIEAHSGSITAQSLGTGKGSTFNITLPTSLPKKQDPKTLGPLPSYRESGPAKILLVEDHVDTARVLSLLLRRLGHQVRVADSVESGLASALSEPPDLLISDLGLPDGTGVDLLRKIRATHNDICAIALTGFGMEDDVARSLEAGFREHLTKPINFQRLQLTIERLTSTPVS